MDDENSDNANLLNPNQRRGLTTALCVMEEMLCGIEQKLTGSPSRGVLYKLRDDLPTQVKEELLKKIALFRERIETMTGEFALESRNKDISKGIRGNLAYGWEVLQGTKASHLKGYGAVAEGLSDA